MGTHQAGAPAATVESLLASCAQILDQDPNTNYIYFVTRDNGVPTTCSYAPKNQCIDDCTQGLTIENFACGPLQVDGGGDARAD